MSELDIHQIMTLLPHRYPFILVDRVLELHPGERLVAIKNVTINEPFFPGHFPGRPIMPGVMMVEAMAQASGLLALKSQEQEDKLFLLTGVDRTRFKRQVSPGDQLRMEVMLRKVKRTLWAFEAQAFVGDQLACSTELLLTEVA